jgi:hypothetical protein
MKVQQNALQKYSEFSEHAVEISSDLIFMSSRHFHES